MSDSVEFFTFGWQTQAGSWKWLPHLSSHPLLWNVGGFPSRIEPPGGRVGGRGTFQIFLNVLSMYTFYINLSCVMMDFVYVTQNVGELFSVTCLDS